MDQLLREKGQVQLEKEHLSRVASDVLKEFNGGDRGAQIEAVVAFYSPQGLNATQLKLIKTKLLSLDKNKLKIHSILNPFENKELRARLVSKDETTLMSIVVLEKGQRTALEVQRILASHFNIKGIQTYLTGRDFINEDFIKASVDSVKSTEAVTIMVIIMVLLVVFRSPVTPLISLSTVGISYLISLSIVLHLVRWFNFPFSNTTQIFLILVLFGIGTDYTILLLMRYKEEYLKEKSSHKALLNTYKTAGRTVFFSAIAVFVGFSMVGFSRFSIYQSLVAVAIGIIILVMAIFTLVPFFIRLFGKALFWPVEPTKKVQMSRVWAWLSNLTVKRVTVAISIIFVTVLPAVCTNIGPFSFNNMKEIDSETNSIKGFHIIANHFGKGETLPATVVIKTNSSLNTSKGLMWIDQINQRLQGIPGVAKVYGPTRPLGEPIDQLYLNTQAKQLGMGLDKFDNGLGQVSGGLRAACNQLPSSNKDTASSVDKLVQGTSAIIRSLKQANRTLTEIGKGLDEGANHSVNLIEAAQQLEENMATISLQVGQLHNRYQQIVQTFISIYQEYFALEQQAAAINATAIELKGLANGLGSDDASQKVRLKAAMLKQQVQTLQSHFDQVNTEFKSTLSLFQQANSQLNLITEMMSKITAGASRVKLGVQTLVLGLKQGAEGQEQMTTGLAKIEDGLEVVNQGQSKMSLGLQHFSARLGTLKHGLHKGYHGIDQISSGLGYASAYLGEVSSGATSFFAPKKIRESTDFQKMITGYLSNDKHSVKWVLTFYEDPYSEKAMAAAKRVQDTVRSIKQGYPSVVQAGVGGVSSGNYDLQQISHEDINRTFVLVFMGIGFVLILLFRCIWITAATLFSLIIAYYSSLALTKLLFVNGLGQEGLSWTTPFFTFIMIVALGVDYSIFLLMRFMETDQDDPVNAILMAARYTGKAVISAMVILSGTFAAMYPSGVSTLMQTATVVIMGLIVLTIILPLAIPLAIRGRESWKKRRSASF